MAAVSSGMHTKPQKEPAFLQLNELAAKDVGGKILFSTDDWYAPAENLLNNAAAEFREGYKTDCGKWMDGWETRRKRNEGYNWCVIQLGIAGRIEGLDVDTSFFTGNFAPRFSIQAASLDTSYKARDSDRLGTQASEAEISNIQKLHSEDWEFVVAMSELKPGYPTSCHNYFPCTGDRPYTHVRLNIYPDGGIARLRIYGQACPNWSKVSEKRVLDLTSAHHGGVCIGCSRSDSGGGRNLIKAGRGESTSDGWEVLPLSSRPAVVQFDRSGNIANAGSEWCMFQLGHPGIAQMVEVDTNNFKGNFPDTCTVQACFVDSSESKHMGTIPASKWKTLLPRSKLKAHRQHFFDNKHLDSVGVISHVRIFISPDGGISRFRVWGNKASGVVAKL